MSVPRRRGEGGRGGRTAGAEHRRGVLGLETLGDAEDETLVDADGGRVAAGGLVPVRVRAVVRVDWWTGSGKGGSGTPSSGSESRPESAGSAGRTSLRAVVLVVVAAVLAGEAGRDLGADADRVADLELSDGRADGGNLADDLEEWRGKKAGSAIGVRGERRGGVEKARGRTSCPTTSCDVKEGGEDERQS